MLHSKPQITTILVVQTPLTSKLFTSPDIMNHVKGNPIPYLISMLREMRRNRRYAIETAKIY